MDEGAASLCEGLRMTLPPLCRTANHDLHPTRPPITWECRHTQGSRPQGRTANPLSPFHCNPLLKVPKSTTRGANEQ